MRSTKHRIYVVLDEPRAPWVQTPYPCDQNPWIEVLNFACRWARGSKDPMQAATGITEAVNGCAGLTYDWGGTARPTFAFNKTVYLTEFLDFLVNRRPTVSNRGGKVNCRDCAAIVVVFANVLGCDLHSAVLGYKFHINRVKLIGRSSWEHPPSGDQFEYHDVAWTGGNYYGERVFDACLKVDADCDPWGPGPGRELLPVDMRFADEMYPRLPLKPPLKQQTYRERLCQNKPSGIGRCIPQGTLPFNYGGRWRVK